MKKFIFDNWFKLAVLAVLFFIAWVIYQAAVVIPRERQNEINTNKQLLINEEQRLKLERSDNLTFCLEQADEKEKSDIRWYINYYEEKYGKNWGNNDVSTMAFNLSTKDIKTATKQSKDECYKRYL